MSKTNDDSTKTRELTGAELNQVSGGYIDDALGTGVRSGTSITFSGYKTAAAEGWGNYKAAQAEGYGN